MFTYVCIYMTGGKVKASKTFLIKKVTFIHIQKFDILVAKANE